MAALDLLSGLADGLRASAEPLVAASPLTAALAEACRDEAPDVRQSAFALVGDLARCAPCVEGRAGPAAGEHAAPSTMLWASSSLTTPRSTPKTAAAAPATCCPRCRSGSRCASASLTPPR
jgi:hypothetical protein